VDPTTIGSPSGSTASPTAVSSSLPPRYVEYRRREPEGSTEEGTPRESRARFMAMAGFWTCVFFAVVILAEAVPNLVLRVCD